MDPVITTEQLKSWKDEGNVTVIDVRSQLNNPDAGEAAYEKGHIPGAYYLHLEKDLSGNKEKHGGNHPLPDPEALAVKLKEMGAANEKPVVVYDETNDMFAARAWWLLEYLGHPKAYLLDGGMKAWKAAGHEITSDKPEKRAGTFTAYINSDMTKNMSEVKERTEGTVLLDSRAPKRYRGEVEPMYDKAGHIPGAENYFWQDVLDDHGEWRSKQELQTHFRGLEKADEIIVSCGSGISACPNIAALRRAGFKNVKLYPGSYSDWISYEENPVATGEE